MNDDQCKDQPSIEVSALWSLTCKNLNKILPMKNLYLRDSFHPHFIRSFAVYECLAGYGFTNGETQATIFCNSSGVWEPNLENLEPCQPIFCTAPPIEPSEHSFWNITYKLFFQHDISPMKTSLKVECVPDKKYDFKKN